MTVLVTGATGFIGQRLCVDLERRGLVVVRMSSRRVWGEGLEVVRTTPTWSPEQLHGVFTTCRPSTVFHLATRFTTDNDASQIASLISSNVTFGVCIADLASRFESRFVYTASAWQRHPGGASGGSLYAASKQALHVFLDQYADARGLDRQIVYLFDTYGPGDSRGKIVQRLMEASLRGSPLDMGSPSKLINLSHVDDVVAGLLLAAFELPSHDDWVMRAEEPVSLGDLANSIGRALNRTVPVRWNILRDRPYDMWEDWRFGRPLPDFPRVQLDDGLRQLGSTFSGNWSP
jgi:CDP-paratose synthetase